VYLIEVSIHAMHAVESMPPPL